MIKVLETKKVNLKFSDLEPGEVFIFNNVVYFRGLDPGDNLCCWLKSESRILFSALYFLPEDIITEIVTKYEYTHENKV